MAEGEGDSLAEMGALGSPMDVSMQHTSVADPMPADPLTPRSNNSDNSLNVPVRKSATQIDSLHLLRGTDTTEDLDSYLDAIAHEAKDRLRQDSVDEALIDWLME